MLLSHTVPLITQAEMLASQGEDFTQILSQLRQLSLDEFGELLISMPSEKFPNLSKVLPAMAPVNVQRTWTGRDGMNLYPTTSQFVRAIESGHARYRGGSLSGKTILDFGCGYGRLIRMMYFFTDAQKIWGVDPWQPSLDECFKVNLPGNFARSDDFPDRLPTNALFDFGFAFSVFTHLRDNAVRQCLSAIRKSFLSGGLLVVTIRPLEFWQFLHGNKGGAREAEIRKAEQDHIENGYGFLPHHSGKLEHYGDSSFKIDFFRSIEGWCFVGHDTLMADPYQILIYLVAE